jgi:hypothetical protein
MTLNNTYQIPFKNFQKKHSKKIPHINTFLPKQSMCDNFKKFTHLI